MSTPEGAQAAYPIYILADDLTFFRLGDPLELQGCTWQHCDREHHDVWDSAGSHFTLSWEPQHGGFLVFDKRHDADGFSLAVEKSIAWTDTTAPTSAARPGWWLRMLAAGMNLVGPLVDQFPQPRSNHVVDPDELRALAQAMRRAAAAEQAPES